MNKSKEKYSNLYLFIIITFMLNNFSCASGPPAIQESLISVEPNIDFEEELRSAKVIVKLFKKSTVQRYSTTRQCTSNWVSGMSAQAGVNQKMNEWRPVVNCYDNKIDYGMTEKIEPPDPLFLKELNLLLYQEGNPEGQQVILNENGQAAINLKEFLSHKSKNSITRDFKIKIFYNNKEFEKTYNMTDDLLKSIFSAKVKNINVRQDGKIVLFEYDLEGDTNEANIFVNIICNGITYPSEQLHLRGDVGKVKIASGKKIIWDFLQDFPRGFAGNLQWEITAR
jgi:hypothetical protein